MTTPSRRSLDAAILDAAGMLFARHGYEQTSIQSIADALDFSKAGLLHHYPSKTALYQAVLDQCRAEMERIHARLTGTPAGPERDRSAIRLLVDLALVRPGLVSLLLDTVTPSVPKDGDTELGSIRQLLFRTFDDDVPAIGRTIRVMGSTAALGVLALAAIQRDDTSEWRDEIINTSFDALGHNTATD